MGRENLQKAVTSALKDIDPSNPLMAQNDNHERFINIFTEKVEALSGEDSEGGDSGGDENFKAYLYHLSKLEGVDFYIGNEPNDALVKIFCANALNRLAATATKTTSSQNNAADNSAPAMTPDNNSSQADQEEQDIALAARIDAAFMEEFMSLGAVQSIKKYYRNKQLKFASRKKRILYIVENFILGGRTLITDIPDNGIMTPAGRFSKLLYYASVNTGSASTTFAIFNVLNYIFFGAMVFYLLQLPALYFFRKIVYKNKKEKQKLSGAEIGFYLVGCAIFGLVGGATFVSLFWPFVISVFGLAFIAHGINLILTGFERGSARKEYEASLNKIADLRNDIARLQEERARLYKALNLELKLEKNDPQRNPAVKKELKRQILALNKRIADTTSQLDEQVSAHNDIRKKHETAFNNGKLKFAVTAVILAALVLTFFILSTPACPAMFIPALVVLVILGALGAGLVIAKTRHKYRNEEKSKREHAIEVDISEKIPLTNEPQNIETHTLAMPIETNETEKGKADAATFQALPLTTAEELSSDDESKPLLEKSSATNSSSTKTAVKTLGVISLKLDASDLSILKQNSEFSNSDTVKSLAPNSVGLFSGKSKEGYIEKSYNSNGNRIRLYGSRRIKKDQKSILDEAIEMNKPGYTKPGIAVGSN